MKKNAGQIAGGRDVARSVSPCPCCNEPNDIESL